MLPEDEESYPRYSGFIILGMATFYTFSLLIDKLRNEKYVLLVWKVVLNSRVGLRNSTE